MKNKRILLFSLTAFLSGSSLMAQTAQNWKTTGNALESAGKLGTTNSQDVQFISNNVVNGLLNKNGRWGFGTGTALPAARLHINSASGEDALRVQVNNSTKLLVTNTGGVTIGSLSNGPVNGLFVSGNTGIGTSSPSSKLHVRLGSSGTTPFFQSVITAENSSNAYINLLAPKANESGILFGTSANNVDGGIIYNSTFASPALNGLQFRTNGNFPRMILNKDGLLNVGPGKNDDYRVRIDNRDVLGLDIANSAANTDWEIFADDDGLFLFSDGGAGGPAGVFDRVTGVYTARPFDNFQNSGLQNNAKPMSNVLEKISQLKASTFQAKTAKSQQEYNGFGVQEVMKVFPNLVTHHVNAKRKFDMYTMDYNGFGVIAIKGIQELMKQNDSLKSEVESLKAEMMQIKSMLNIGSQSTGSGAGKLNVSLTNASLDQNTPNPFPNSTVISYTLPQHFSKANILVADRSGKTIKQINLTGSGKGRVNVEASSLLPGTYNYSLIVDGKVIDSKQMIITR
jgi:hypothetical protein